ncbi:hypothetical protein QTI66_36415 [Variovorax sp. J22R133]|uniref:hypothetical protein n=1 Tax=Variovorax brevis TaxID=3053503 RepID=UPI002577D8AA|nr:hypothetical protein [Variovorax sp. J22R133]MDM0116809.1 hypothetical protein [Variovorax sp. J22R133]MDM0117598.1 hypothetical protein [Variovorax sp. J22R133]
MKLLGSCPKCGEALASPTLADAVLGHQECDRCSATFDMPAFERRLWLVNLEQMLKQHEGQIKQLKKPSMELSIDHEITTA